MSSALAGRRVVVVGASSGLGRGVAVRAVRAGADVVLAARRADRLAEVADEAGGGRPVVVDLRDDETCRQLADDVRATLGHVDLLVVSAGAAPLRRLVATRPEDWRDALETNLVGINRVLVALVDLLGPESVVAVVSSEVVEAPRSHLGAYGASKAALEHSLAQWREEHPWLRLTTISLGATVPTEFGHGFDGDEIVEALEAWTSSGRQLAAFMDTEQVCDVLAATLGSLLVAPTIGIERLTLRSPAPPVGDAEEAVAIAAASRDPGSGGERHA